VSSATLKYIECEEIKNSNDDSGIYNEDNDDNILAGSHVSTKREAEISN
jgi:hypothetical protein